MKPKDSDRSQDDSSYAQGRRRKKKHRYPLPESARGLTAEQVARTSPLYFVLRWETYVAITAFVLAITYFPWVWVADWGVMRVLVVAMEQLVASIDKLPAQARNLPVDASKAQLSIIHIVGAVTLIYRLCTQRPTMYREAENWRYFNGFLVCGVFGLFFSVFTFLWPGYFPEGEGYEWHESILQVSGFYTVVWFFQFTLISWAWSYLQKLIIRFK
jgi:hypothetical protein